MRERISVSIPTPSTDEMLGSTVNVSGSGLTISATPVRTPGEPGAVQIPFPLERDCTLVLAWQT